jgi:hypothetical protein
MERQDIMMGLLRIVSSFLLLRSGTSSNLYRSCCLIYDLSLQLWTSLLLPLVYSWSHLMRWFC